LVIPMRMRLNRFLARCGISSRRKSEEILREGLVCVNNCVERRPFTIIDTESDVITVKGEIVKIQKNMYLMMNKPEGVLTTVSDDRGRLTVIDVVREMMPELTDDVIKGLFPVGRLDKDTTGVLLLTNDGDLCAKIIHPRNEIEKVYFVKLNKKISQGDFERIKSGGVEIDGRKVNVNDFKYISNKENVFLYRLSIIEGRNRIVKRLFNSLGYRVSGLERVAIGRLSLGELAPGKVIFLRDRDIEKIFK